MFDDRVAAYLKVIELGSFTDAARALCMTQPGVTRQIKSLESELGVSLVDRTKSPVVPTEAGAVALRHLRTLIEDERNLIDALEPYARREHEFVVCFGADAINYERTMFYHLMREAVSIYGPGVRAVPAKGEKTDLSRLLNGEIDLLMGSMEKTTGVSNEIRCRPLFKARFGVACSHADSLATHENVQVKDLDRRVLYLMDDNPQCQQWLLDDLAARHDVKVEMRHVPTLAAAIPLIEMGAGIAFVAMNSGLSEETAFVPYEAPWECTIGPCWLKRRQTPRLLRYVDVIAAAYTDPDQPWDQAEGARDQRVPCCKP